MLHLFFGCVAYFSCFDKICYKAQLCIILHFLYSILKCYVAPPNESQDARCCLCQEDIWSMASCPPCTGSIDQSQGGHYSTVADTLSSCKLGSFDSYNSTTKIIQGTHEISIADLSLRLHQVYQGSTRS